MDENNNNNNDTALNDICYISERSFAFTTNCYKTNMEMGTIVLVMWPIYGMHSIKDDELAINLSPRYCQAIPLYYRLQSMPVKFQENIGRFKSWPVRASKKFRASRTVVLVEVA